MFAKINQFPGPSLPAWFLFPVTGLFALITFYWIFRTRGTAARYLIFACYARYTIGAFHEYTYREAVAGLRWVAIGSILLISMGLVLLDKRRIFAKPFVPVAIICLLMIISAIVNRDLGGAIDPLLRMLFFVLVATALWQALESQGAVVLRRLLIVFVQPLLFQLASLVLDLPKSGELDGSLSYIGGYYHEELFSLILITAFLVAILAKGLSLPVKLATLVLSFVGIYLTDYRTSMAAAVPLALTAALSAGPKAFRHEQRAFVRLVIGALGAVFFIATIGAVENRFSDFRAIGQVRELVKPPEQYSFADQRVMSSRPFIWSQYISAYVEAPTTQKVIGFGPDSWVGKFPLYAHNTMVSFLYETGVVGVFSLLWLWLTMFRLALRAPADDRPVIIGGHIAFFLLNMATMPHWQIEGNIFYGLLCGYTIAKSRVESRRKRNAGHLNRPSRPVRPATVRDRPSGRLHFR